ncbi:MAG: hypothetical protein WCC79_10670 [Nitrososphaeraceae archaeon]
MGSYPGATVNDGFVTKWHSKLLRIIFSAENVVIEIWIPAISAVFGIVSVIFTVYVSNI